MPAFLEPDQTFPIVLDIDKDKPADAMPVFLAISVSMREATKLTNLIDALTEDAKDTEEIYSRAIAAVIKYVKGWKNMGGLEFSETNLRNLTYLEARELLRKVYSNQHVQIEEKKS